MVAQTISGRAAAAARAGAATARAAAAAAVAVLLLAGVPTTSAATSVGDLPPSVRALPMDRLLSLFEVSFETPNVAGEIARHRAWAPPVADEVAACDGLARVIREYPRTSDARRALLDIGGIYARKGDWRSAEAPFRYVMEMMKGQSAARIAHFRLIEMYRYAGAPGRMDPITECRAAVNAYAGTPEEGLGRMLLGDLLAERRSFEAAFAEFERVIEQFPNQPYTSYARIRYALALTGGGEYERAREVLAPVLEDPVWAGRAYWARGEAYRGEGNTDAAVADYRRGAQAADSLWIRGESCLELGHIYASKFQLGPAREWLQACLAITPSRPDRLEIRREIINNLYASGAYVEAAEGAIELEMYVLNAPARYSEAEITETTRLCDDILDRCEMRLSGTGGE